MQTTLLKVSSVLAQITVEVPATEVDQILLELSTAGAAGFEPTRLTLAELSKGLVGKTLPRALSDSGVIAVNAPDVETGPVQAGKPFLYTARFEMQPVFAAIQCEGLKLVRRPAKATQAMIGEELQKLRTQHGTFKAVDRAAHRGDFVTLSFGVEVAGKEVQSVPFVRLELGLDQLYAELDGVLKGLSVGETAVAPVEFTHLEQLDRRADRGQIRAQILKIEEIVRPETAELAKMLDFETPQAFVDSVAAKIATGLIEEDLSSQMMDQLIELNPIDVPPSMIAEQLAQTVHGVRAQAWEQGLTLKSEVVNTLPKELLATAERTARAGLLMAAIARNLHLAVADDDFAKAHEELAGNTGEHPSLVRYRYGQGRARDVLAGLILQDKVLDVIEKTAVVTVSRFSPAPGAGTKSVLPPSIMPSNVPHTSPSVWPMAPDASPVLAKPSIRPSMVPIAPPSSLPPAEKNKKKN